VVFRIAGIKDEFAGAGRKRVFDEAAWEKQAALIGECAALGGQHLYAAWDGLGEANRFKNLQCSFVNANDVALAQGLVLPTGHARMDGRLLERYRPRAQRAPRIPATATTRKVFSDTH